MEKVFECECGRLNFGSRCSQCGEKIKEHFFARTCAEKEIVYGNAPCERLVVETLSSPKGRIVAETTHSNASEWSLDWE